MASVYWDYVRYEAHIPAMYLDEVIIEIVRRFAAEGIKIEYTEHGVYFDCFHDHLHEVNDWCSPLRDSERPYYSLDSQNCESSVCAGLLNGLIEQSRVSLVYVEKSYCDSGCGYDAWEEPQNEDYWERQIENCPTLILREVLAKRSE